MTRLEGARLMKIKSFDRQQTLWLIEFWWLDLAKPVKSKKLYKRPFNKDPNLILESDSQIYIHSITNYYQPLKLIKNWT